MTTHQQRYWLIVRDCLTVIHGLLTQQANARIAEFCELLKDNDTFIYDQEPFWTACALTENDIDIKECLAHYLFILQRFDSN